MCTCAVKYFEKYGWVGAKNRDRGYPTKIEIVQSNKDGIQRIYIDDTLSRWTEGVNEFGVGIISASFSVKRDEKEGELASKGKSKGMPKPGDKYKKSTDYYSPDGKKIRKALLQTTAKDAIMLLQEEELAGATYAFDTEHCYLLEGGWNVSKEEETKDNPRKYTSTVTEISKEVGWSARTNHGINVPTLGYSSTATDEKFIRARKSSESRLAIAAESVPDAVNPRDLMTALARCPNKDDQFMNPIRKGDPAKGEMVTTGQILIVSGDRTLHYRPIHSSIEFDYHKLNGGEKAKTFFEIISDRSLLKMYESLNASSVSASGKLFRKVDKGTLKDPFQEGKFFMTPDLRLISVQDHEPAAAEILGGKYDSDDSWMDRWSAQLAEAGWVRVICDGESLVFSWKASPSQIRELKNLAIENQLILIDDVNSKYRVLWQPGMDEGTDQKNFKKLQIYCDMDGVLIDFDTPLKKLTGGLLWNDAVKEYGLEELWRRINAGGVEWWSDLSWAQDGHQLWNFIKDKNPIILTAGATSMTGDRAERGKKIWCARELGNSFEVIVADHGKDKKYWAAPNHILIDDLEENIRAWRSRGGIGILHRNATQTIAELKDHLLSWSDDPDALEEDWRSLAAAGLIGAASLTGAHGASAKHHSVPHNKAHITHTISNKMTPLTATTPEQLLMGYENSKDNPNGGYDKASGKWFPARSLEGGSDTIAYGHKIQPDEDFSAGLTDSEALNLLKKDIAIREASIRMNLPSYDTLPQYVKNAILSAWYRGDLGPRATPKTWALITSGNWSHVANEYLNSKDFRSGLSGVKKRMQDNADAFSTYAQQYAQTKVSRAA